MVFLVRVLLDRAHTDYDNIFHGLDPEVLHPPSRPPTPPTTTSRSPAADKFASTSETNTSDRISSSSDPSLSSPSSTDLSHILLSIKSCRWRHFRPRTLPLHELDNAHPIFRKLSRGLKRRAVTLAAGGQAYQRPARAVAAAAPVVGKLIGVLLEHAPMVRRHRRRCSPNLNHVDADCVALPLQTFCVMMPIKSFMHLFAPQRPLSSCRLVSEMKVLLLGATL